MGVEYSTSKDFEREQLQSLFLSVEWESGHHPEKLQLAMQNSHSVFSAWENGRLVGLINAISDGVMAAYVPYLLVRPEYQGRGIGMQLVRMFLEEYRDCARKTLIAYDTAVPFYKRCGFEAGEGKKPMFVSSL